MAITRFGMTPDPFDMLVDALRAPFGGFGARNLMRPPDADVIETKDEIRIVVDLPGLTRDDIEIELENNVLTLSGEKREETIREDEEGRYHIAERRYGRFSRSFMLPGDVDADHIEATFENGVLTIAVPKSEQARRRRVEIRGGDGAH
ncbi:MAG TPA: Hsp20/alpha crystallin family protein [Longimicrobiales bacterium]|nr:Hsp20/alpha crystallin family protein [Longimicrobiales bacterium]